MSKAKKETVEVTTKVAQPEAKLPPNVFTALVIHTKTGKGLLVERKIIDGSESFVMTHLGNGGCVPVGIEGARALKILLDDWISLRDEWGQTEWSLAT